MIVNADGKISVNRVNDRWHVTCGTCDNRSMWMFGAPVVVADVHADAVWWATWHAAEHARTKCGSCGHEPDVPRVTPLDGDTVRVDDRLFVRAAGGWREVAA